MGRHEGVFGPGCPGVNCGAGAHADGRAIVNPVDRTRGRQEHVARRTAGLDRFEDRTWGIGRSRLLADLSPVSRRYEMAGRSRCVVLPPKVAGPQGMVAIAPEVIWLAADIWLWNAQALMTDDTSRKAGAPPWRRRAMSGRVCCFQEPAIAGMSSMRSRGTLPGTIEAHPAPPDVHLHRQCPASHQPAGSVHLRVCVDGAGTGAHGAAGPYNRLPVQGGDPATCGLRKASYGAGCPGSPIMVWSETVPDVIFV